MIAATTSFSALAKMPNGTVTIGNKAFDLAYANDPTNIGEITNAIVSGGTVNVKDFSGNWIDNNTGLTVNATVIQAVVYKSATGVISNYDPGDIDHVDSEVEDVATANVAVIALQTAASKDLTVEANLTGVEALVQPAKDAVVKVNDETIKISLTDLITSATETITTARTVFDEAIAENTAEVAVKTAETSRKSDDIEEATKAVALVKDAIKASAFTARINAVMVLVEVSSVSAITATAVGGDTYVLPPTVTVTLEGGITKELAVTWDKVADTTVAGSYTFTGTLTMVEGVVNTDEVKVNATLTVVSAISDDTDITSKFTDKIFRNVVYFMIRKTSPEPILYSDVNDIKELLLNGIGPISSLNGIEYLTALTYLSCSNNLITTLDLSKNTALTYLECYNNQLATLDVSKNTALTYLQCYNNQLANLVVSKNTALTYLSCSNNLITTLDLSKNTALTSLACSRNPLINLDVSKNTALTGLYCGDNQLTTLDVSKNTALTYLECTFNQLTTLYSIKDTWDTYYYQKQYTDSSHTATTKSLVITIKN